jgi:hypothetical protein
MFYNAMIIFARKHFSQKNAQIFSILIHLAIYLRASVAILNRFITRLSSPFLDGVFLYGGTLVLKNYWEQYVKYEEGIHYPREFMLYVLPSYIAVWLFSAYLTGAYDRPVRPMRSVRGVVAGTLAILVAYALLPEHLRFSRALILLGAAWASVCMPLLRFLLHLTGLPSFRLAGNRNLRFAVIGSVEESMRVADIIKSTHSSIGFIAPVSIEKSTNPYFTGSISQLNEIVEIYRIDEVVFCSKDVPSHEIITQMTRLRDTAIDFKIAPPDSIALIGSSSIHTSGDIYIYDVNTILSAQNRRNKRLVDISVSILFLTGFPLMAIICRKPAGLFRNILLVMAGRLTWVGFDERPESVPEKLPGIRKGIIPHTRIYSLKSPSADTLNKLNVLYAKDYRFIHDIHVIIRSLHKTGA